MKVDHAFLESLATRSGGSYSPEGKTEELLERLDELLLASAELHDTPLVKIAALFNLFPLYIILLMGALLWEWILRRRMNIV